MASPALPLVRLIMFFSTVWNKGTKNIKHELMQEAIEWYKDSASIVDEMGFNKRTGKNPMKTNLKESLNCVIREFNNKDHDEDQFVEYLHDLGHDLKVNLPKIAGKNSIPQDEINFLNQAQVYLRTDSDSAFKQMLNKLGTVVNHGQLSALWAGKAVPKSDQKKLVEKMKALVEKFTNGKVKDNPRYPWSAEIEEKLEENFPKELEQWRSLSKEAGSIAKDFITNYIRKTGKGMVPVPEVYEALEKAGITYYNIPTGMDNRVLIAEGNRYYTKDGKQIKLTQTAGWVKWNERYNPNGGSKGTNSVLYGKGWKSDPRTQPAKYGTFEGKTSSKNVTQEKVEKFSQNAEQYRKRWIADLGSTNPTKQTLATLTEILYQLAPRVGSEKGALQGRSIKGDKTQGLTVLRPNNISFYVRREGRRTLAERMSQADVIKFSYLGKKSIKQEHEYEIDRGNSEEALITQRVATNIARLVAKAEQRMASNPRDPQARWVFVAPYEKRGKLHQDVLMNDDRLHNYLKSIGMDISPHKFRHAKGNKLFKENILSNMPKALISYCKNPKNSVQSKNKLAMEWLRTKVAKIIAPSLGHKSASGKSMEMTSLENYIGPLVQAEYYKKLGVRYPTYLRKDLPAEMLEDNNEEQEESGKLRYVEHENKKEFVPTWGWFKKLSHHKQRKYLNKHPNSRFHMTKFS